MTEPDRSATAERPPTPAWVKAFAVLGGVLLVLLVLVLAGVLGEGHGPGRHG